MKFLLSRILRILLPPVYRDEEEQRIAGIVHTLCYFIGLGMVLAAANNALSGQWNAVVVLAIGEGLVIASLWLCHAGRLLQSTRLLVFSILSMTTILLWVAGQGIHDVVIMVYPGSLVVASQLLRRRSFVAYTVVLILCVAGVVAAEMTGLLITRMSLFTRWRDLIDISLILAVTAVAVEMLTESLRESLFQTRRNETALAVGNLELERQSALLRKSEEQQREVFDAMDVAIIVQDEKTGAILDTNKTAAEMFGYSRSELWMVSINDLSSGEPPFSGDEAAQWIHQAIEKGPLTFEWRSKRKNGELFWTEVTLRSTSIGGEGRVMTVVRDISKRKHAEEELSESRQMLRSILDTIPVRVFWKDLDLKFIGCNLPFAQDAGFSEPAQLIGRSDLEMAWRDQAELYRADDRLVIESGVPKLHYEEPQTTPDGRKIWLRTSKAPLLDTDGKIRGVLCTYEDITERKQLEEQLRQAQKMEAFGQLAGGVAHDFNNILTVILSHASLMEMGRLSPEELSQSIRQISQVAERAANLTRQLLTFSRRQVMHPVDLDLNEIVRSMTKMLQRFIGEHIAFESDYAPGGAPVHVDPGMVEQVLMNLFVNSRDAMPRGGRLSIRTETLFMDPGATLLPQHPKARPGRFVRLSIADTGKGIPPEHMPRIFEPFFTTKEAGKGTGLGLATVFGIVEQHQGWIEVESVIDKGTTFHIYLPLKKEGPMESAPEPGGMTGAPGGTETILLVEDEDPVRTLARNVLEHKGYAVHEAPDGQAALKIWERHMESIDLLLTDLIMPGDCSGRELAERLLAQKPGLKVIYCSGYSDEMLGGDFVLRQYLHFLQKPYNLAKLALMVRACLDAPAPELT